MAFAARYGKLELLKALNDPESVIYDIVRATGDLELTFSLMNKAAANGHLACVEWLHEQLGLTCTTKAMDDAAKNGHMEVVHWLHENRFEGCTTDAMDDAGSNGDFDLVQWLHEHRAEGCTTSAMIEAAREGYLDIVPWLYFNPMEVCTTQVMDWTIANGHLEEWQICDNANSHRLKYQVLYSNHTLDQMIAEFGDFHAVELPLS